MKKNRANKKQFLAVLLSGVLLCGGCGSSARSKTPELVEPVAANAAYRPVELGSIGETKVLYGTVMPTEYCCFFDSYAGIEEITVEVGDYVEAGAIVAYADVDRAQEQLNDLNAQLTNENQNYDLNKKIADIRIQKIKDEIKSIEKLQKADTSDRKEKEEVTEKVTNTEEGKKAQAVNDAGEGKNQELGDTEETKVDGELTVTETAEQIEGLENTEQADSTETTENLQVSENTEEVKKEEMVENTEVPENAGNLESEESTEISIPTESDLKVAKTSLATEKENMRYDEILHNYRVKKIQKAISDQQEIVAEGTLKAPHSGYVIYIKNMGESTDASAYENIVVIADSKETYIEITDKTIDRYLYEDYEVKYMQLAGKRYDVKELSYDIDVEILAKASNRYPNVRISCPDSAELTIGETYPIFYREKQLEEVPIIGLDSLNGDEGNYFVYVKNENGEQEKRSITIGEKDDYYAQVLSGVDVGEEVYYESDSSMPATYEEYTVTLADYSIGNLSREYQLADEQTFWYDSECEGTITEIAVREGDEVVAGDLLFVMESQSGKAALAAAQNNITRENTTYKKNIKQINNAIKKEKDKENKKILNFQKELETINHTYRLGQLEKTYSNMAKNNDGNGKISIYAKQSGEIDEITIEEGDAVSTGNHVLSIGTVAKDKLLVQMAPLEKERNYEGNIAEFGEKILVTVEDTIYEGICTGMTVHQRNNMSKYYVTMKEDEPAISYCASSGYDYPAFYVEMEDESFYESLPKDASVTFSYVEMENVLVVPTSIVKEETNENDPAQTDYFVWRVVGDELVKQYVLINKEYSDVVQTVILSGVQEQDILAREK